MSDYFGLLGISRKFTLDEAELKTRYFALQREAHPDKAGAAGLGKAMDVNKAYQTLKEPITRAEYLLALAGIKADKPCVEILMEAMEQRELLAEISSEAGLTKLRKDIKLEAETSVRALKKFFEANDLEKAKKETTRLKYLTKLLEEIRLKSLETV